jgi:hypothetical protein
MTTFQSCILFINDLTSPRNQFKRILLYDTDGADHGNWNIDEIVIYEIINGQTDSTSTFNHGTLYFENTDAESGNYEIALFTKPDGSKIDFTYYVNENEVNDERLSFSFEWPGLAQNEPLPVGENEYDIQTYQESEDGNSGSIVIQKLRYNTNGQFYGHTLKLSH